MIELTSPLVIIPGDKLDKVSVQGNTGLSVEGRRSRVTSEVG